MNAVNTEAREMTAFEVMDTCEKFGLAVICEDGKVSDVIIEKRGN